MKIFIDVGGHFGETIQAVLDPAYAFEKIYSFEPVHSCAQRMRETVDDGRVIIIEAGLSTLDGEAKVFGAGGLGASIYEDHPHVDGPTETCRFLDASKWFRDNISRDDKVYVKLNCEGSECDILDSLLDSGEYAKVTDVMIDFDARKIPSQEYRVESLKRRLHQGQYCNVSFPEDLMYGMGSHFGGIRNWLNQKGARTGGIKLKLESLTYHLANIWHRRHLGFYKLKIIRLSPQTFVSFYYERVNRK